MYDKYNGSKGKVQGDKKDKTPAPNATKTVKFVSMVVSSFEGIGLVLK